MRYWTPEERQRQSELIHQWKPWTKGGVKTPEGKAKSRMNAFKHGMYTAHMRKEMADFRELMREHREIQRMLESKI